MSAFVERQEPSGRDWTAAHLLVVLAVSVAYESLFLHHGLNVVDEGWPLYAAMQLHAGGTLYQDVFFVFPPGHLLTAWVAYALDPPGVVLARALYSSFTVALNVCLYLVGRKIMPPGYALFGTLLLAVGATSSHMQQLLFGYRYLVISALAVLAFARWLDDRRPRWLLVAGALTGLALVFRLTPAFAVGCAIGVAVIAAGGSWRDWLRSWSWYGAGIVLVAGPVVGWFLASVGPEKLWLEAVVRPVAMTDRQSLPVPELTAWPDEATRKQVQVWFVAVQFRLWSLLYAAYGVGLALAWSRAALAGRRFAHPLLLCFVLWGGIYFVRSFGRSDAPHLYSAIPPVCLLIGHAAFLGVRWLESRGLPGAARRPLLLLGASVFAGLWIYLLGVDRPLEPGYRGDAPLRVFDGEISLRKTSSMRSIDRKVRAIRMWTQPEDRILDVSASSLVYVLSERRGPGYADVLMPGTFLSDEEELAFLRRLQGEPPALVVWPAKHFDEDPERSIVRSAPRVARWVRQNYEPKGRRDHFLLMVPREAGPVRTLPGGALRDGGGSRGPGAQPGSTAPR